jgi:putative hydrolase of the HAD superfamily
MKRAVEHIVFDFGDVLNHHLKAKEEKDALVQAAEMEPAVFFERYWHHRCAYDTGKLDARQYWKLVLDNPTDGKITLLRQIDVQVAVRLNFDMWRWIRRLKSSGKVLTLLSNMPHDLARYHERSSVHDNFHHTFFSCDIGMAKPDPDIYRFVQETTGIAPQNTLLLDDTAENIAAAREAGWEAVQFRSLEQTAILLGKKYDLPAIPL